MDWQGGQEAKQFVRYPVTRGDLIRDRKGFRSE